MAAEPPLKHRWGVCAVTDCHKRNGILKVFKGESEVTQRLEYDSRVMCSIHKAHLASQQVTNISPELCRTDFIAILKLALPHTPYYLKCELGLAWTKKKKISFFEFSQSFPQRAPTSNYSNSEGGKDFWRYF